MEYGPPKYKRIIRITRKEFLEKLGIEEDFFIDEFSKGHQEKDTIYYFEGRV